MKQMQVWLPCTYFLIIIIYSIQYQQKRSQMFMHGNHCVWITGSTQHILKTEINKRAGREFGRCKRLAFSESLFSIRHQFLLKGSVKFTCFWDYLEVTAKEVKLIKNQQWKIGRGERKEESEDEKTPLRRVYERVCVCLCAGASVRALLWPCDAHTKERAIQQYLSRWWMIRLLF